MAETYKDIWKIRVESDQYRTFDVIDRSINIMNLLDKFKAGKPLSQDWEPISLYLYNGGEEGEESRPIPDITNGVVTKAINERARFFLEPLIANQVEFLPLITPVGPYYELNIKFVDCLDVQHSDVKRFSDSDEIMRVIKYAFYWNKVKNVNIFVIPELNLSCFFVSNAFKKAIEENNLTGLIFDAIPLA